LHKYHVCLTDDQLSDVFLWVKYILVSKLGCKIGFYRCSKLWYIFLPKP